MKIMLVGDIHLSERPPSSCTDSYCDDLFDLLEQARQVGVQRGIAAWCWAGDVFHHKAPNRVSHRLVHRLCAFLETCEPYFPVLIVPGNHDIANDRVESVLESQPLGVVFRSRLASQLIGWHESLPVYGVPWLQGYGDWGAYDGDDPHPLIEVNLANAFKGYREQVFQRGTGNQLPLVVTHAPLYPEGKELRYEYFPVTRWGEAMGAHNGGSHHVFYGHVHEPHSTHGYYGADPAGGDYDVTFCNNGALSRGSLHEYNLTRQVGVTLYDSLKGNFEFVPLNAKPASEVFRLEEKGRVTDVQGRLDDFLTSVGSTSLEVMNLESVVGHIRSLGLGKDVEALAEELLTEAQHGKGN